jgi:hypothetical protein
VADDNGTTPNPAPPEDTSSADPAVPTSERLMGLVGLAFAIGLALIAIDLMTGGGLARFVPAREPGDG